MALLKKQPSIVRETESYCRTVGELYMMNRYYDSALVFLHQASLATSSPEVYMQIGLCQQALHQYDKAIEAYQTALFIQPNRFVPRYALLQLYLQQKDSNKVTQIAGEIIQLKPKKASADIERYKKIAAQVITHYKTSYQQDYK